MTDTTQSVKNREELTFPSEYGGFDLKNKEYVINHGAKIITPRPWGNVIANPHFGTIVTESGLGATWFDNSKDNRISSWSNDTVCDPSSEAVYIKDNSTGKIWSVTRLPTGTLDNETESTYKVQHGNGYSIFRSNSGGIEQSMTVTVDMTDPIKLVSLNLTNTSSEQKNLSLYYYIDVVMGTYKNQFDAFIELNLNPEKNCVEISRGDKIHMTKKVFLSSNLAITSWTSNKIDFIGYTGTLKHPKGLESESFQESTNPRDNCCVIKVDINLAPNETKEAVFILGASANDEEHVNLLAKYRADKASSETLTRVKGFWGKITGQVVIDTPDKSIDVIFNQWLLYQTLSCRIWGRSSFYQSSGAYGFRDQLQDTMGFVYVDKSICRQHILKAAARQFEEGDVQHWWFEDSGLGVRNKVADSPLWLAYVTHFYVEKTGDTSIYDEVIPYLKGKPLTDELSAYVEVPVVSDIQETLWDHCVKAIQKVCDFGVHGIPLIKEGDWNDGMNLVGELGKGESIWLGWFLGTNLESYTKTAQDKNLPEIAEKFQNLFINLKNSMHNFAWEGDWYLRAYTDEGHKLGSSNEMDCKIDSISQSWAILSGMDDQERQTQAMHSAQNYLVDPKNELAMLLYPAFDKGTLNPGYIKDYVPGIRENGGQYSHAAFWFVMALAKQKQADLASTILSYTNPIHRSNTSARLHTYELEPYVIGGDIYSSNQHMAKGGWSWYSASSGLCYRTVLESILGFKQLGNKLKFDPCVPLEWRTYSIKYTFGSSIYDITFKLAEKHNNIVKKINIDWQEIETDTIDLIDDAREHAVLVFVS